MLVSEADGRKVVSIATAETVGKVHEFLVDASSRSIVALVLKKTPSGHVVRWRDLAAFGADAVTVADASVIGEPDEYLSGLEHKDRRALGKRVLSSAGDELGKVDDIDFDPATGAVDGLVVGEQHIAGSRLVGIGSWAVVVLAEPAGATA